MLLFSNGRAVQVVVGDFASASKVGRFMSAVSHFLRTNNPAELREFAGESAVVPDTPRHRAGRGATRSHKAAIVLMLRGAVQP